MSLRRIIAALATFLLLSVTMTPSHANADEGAEQPPTQEDINRAWELVEKYKGEQAEIPTQKDLDRSSEYWTPERLESATPFEYNPTEDSTEPRQLTTEQMEYHRQRERDYEFISRTLGKMYHNKQPRKPRPVKGNPPGATEFPAEDQESDDGLSSTDEDYVSQYVQADTHGPPATTGKIWSVDPDGNAGVCSATVVNSSSGLLISTAAHCVHTGYDYGPGEFHTDIKFAPNYNNGGLYGALWDVILPQVDSYWNRFDVPDNRWNYDVAFAIALPLVDGEGVEYRVEDVAQGGQYMWFHSDEFMKDPNYVWNRNGDIYGYPTEGWNRTDGAHNGHLPFRCSGEWQGAAGDFTLSHGMTPCDMGKGASGGPWLYNLDDDGRGYLLGVTSHYRKTPDGNRADAYLYGTHMQYKGIATTQYANAENIAEEFDQE